MKSRAHNIHYTKGGWGMLLGKFEILHALKCVMVASEASFRAYSKLLSSFSSFRKVRHTGP